MKHQKFWSRFFLVAAILTAALIFFFSAQKGVDSQSLSDEITIRVARAIRPGYIRLSAEEQRSYLEMLSTIIRKNAHFCEFMLLGFNLMGYMRFRDAGMTERRCRQWAWGIATLYAATDELHQLFINERSAQVLDVLIDSAGSLAGTLVMTLALALLARVMRRRSA